MQHRVIFPDFSAFQMSVDAPPLPPCDAPAYDGGATDGAGGGGEAGGGLRPGRRLPPQEGLGPDA